MKFITSSGSGLNKNHPHSLSLLGVSVLGLMLMTGCNEAEKAPPPPPPTVIVTQVQQRDVPVHQEWIGTLDGMVNAQILAQVPGYLMTQKYQEGGPVKKGQLLYEIDPRVFQATLDGAVSNLARQEAVLKTARLDLARVERLLPEKAVSVRDRDNAVGREATAQAEVLVAKSAVENARLQLGFTKILSPIDGVAGISTAQIGDLVGPGSANLELTTISQLDPIKAFIPMSEQQYLHFARERTNQEREHEKASIQLILADGSIYPAAGHFFFAGLQVDIKTGTIQVAILFPNPNNLLRPGQYARVRAIVEQKPNALLVPQRAITEMQGRFLVAVVHADNTVEIRQVKPSVTIDDMQVIDEGLKLGESVIVEGIQKVRPGSKVEPKPLLAESANSVK
ncbi:MAG: efflux RND transporter periplasmic adaptor subunit [Methylomonas lenta]|jgi:membrane fusion protein (multidrug efflux system)|nr:efflux RND transporter periplasmic adaptor subunit [Methylomonas lenta]